MNLSDYAFGERSGGYTVSKPKPAAFYFHYNKPASLSAGEPRMSIHYRDQCLIVKGVECRVPVKSRIMRCAADLKFIAARAMEDLPVDDLELIARIRDDSEHRTAA
jgi:hypothetical protein